LDPNENGLNVLASHSFGDHDTGTSMVSSLGDPRFDSQYKDMLKTLRPRVDLQLTHRILDLPEGGRRHAAVVAMLPDVSFNLVQTNDFDGTAGDYGLEHFLGRLQTEVDIGRSDQPRTLRERMAARLQECDEKLAVPLAPKEVRDPNIRLQRAGALFYLDRLEEAKQELDALVQELPPYAWQIKVRRSMVHARLGQHEAARADVDAFRAKSKEPARVAFLDAFVTAHRGDLDGAERRIEEVVPRARRIRMCFTWSPILSASSPRSRASAGRTGPPCSPNGG
jgi:hypothetical protein